MSALQSFFRYIAFSEPEFVLHCQRILAIPTKRYYRGSAEFLAEEQSLALVAAPDPKKWIASAIQTGLQNNETTAL